MTIIVYRDGIMAADTAQWSCDIIVGHIQKVFRTPAGWLFGCSGTTSEILKIEKWMMADQKEKPPSIRGSSILAVNPDGELLIADEQTKLEFYCPGVKRYVIGVGHPFAMGCMAAGASAEETVRLAIEHIPFIGGDMWSVRLHSRGKKSKSNLPIVKGDLRWT